MRILGLDTATWRASVGLLIDGEIVATRSQDTDGSHAVSLLPLIDAVLRAAGCSTNSLDAVAVSSGPGSFTGLRVGLSIAKGLARATGARLLGVPTLEALARTAADHHGVVCALLDARKGELYMACFESSAAAWRRLTQDAVVTPEVLVETLPTPCVILGDAVDTYGDFLRARLGARVVLLPDDARAPSGGVVARLAWERLQAGDCDEAAPLEPRYIRPCEAELKIL